MARRFIYCVLEDRSGSYKWKIGVARRFIYRVPQWKIGVARRFIYCVPLMEDRIVCP